MAKEKRPIRIEFQLTENELEILQERMKVLSVGLKSMQERPLTLKSLLPQTLQVCLLHPPSRL